MTTRDFAADVSIGPDVGEELRRQSGTYAYWNEALYRLDVASRQRKLELEAYEATAWQMLAADAKAAASRLTEAAFERRLRLDAGWRERRRALDAAEAERDRMKGVLKSLEHKRDSLQALANDRRAEIRTLGGSA